MDGILNIDKPAGMTSFKVVARVKRLSGNKKAGHAGTLDPAATGVLPVCIGQGTRVVEFLVNDSKTYRAQIELGRATDTYDASGQVVRQGDTTGITQEQMEKALNAFRGSIRQIPPMFSAVKRHGRPLYELARCGITVERESRPAQVYRLDMIDWRLPVATVEIECSRGTYIRSIAHDLGQLLGCGAHLKSLVRTRCGIFHINDAVTLSQLEDAFQRGRWQRFLYPPDSVLGHWKAIVVGSEAEDIIRHGGSVVLEEETRLEGQQYPEQTGYDEFYRGYTVDGRFFGVLRFSCETGRWHPVKVFR